MLTLISLLACFSSSPEDAVQAFSTASDIEERLETLRYPERARPLMEKMYETRAEYRTPNYKVVAVSAEEVGLCEWTTAVVTIQELKKSAREATMTFELQRTSEGYLIDWEGSIGTNEMGLPAFRAQMPREPVSMRLTAKLNPDYYNFAYQGMEGSHYSIDLATEGKLSRLHGYVRKDSELGRQLYGKLKDGERHRVTVSIGYPQQGATGPDSSSVTIHAGVVGWVSDRASCPG